MKFVRAALFHCCILDHAQLGLTQDNIIARNDLEELSGETW